MGSMEGVAKTVEEVSKFAAATAQILHQPLEESHAQESQRNQLLVTLKNVLVSWLCSPKLECDVITFSFCKNR